MGVEIADLLKAAVVAIQDVCTQNGCLFLLGEAGRAEMAKMPHALLMFSQGCMCHGVCKERKDNVCISKTR